MDDALSARRLPDERLQLGVHIADVSAFVRQVSLLKSTATCLHEWLLLRLDYSQARLAHIGAAFI